MQEKMATITSVRVEDDTSIGRTYSAVASHDNATIAGLGAKRRLLKTRSFDPYAEETKRSPVVRSLSLKNVNLLSCTREDVLKYFKNSWELYDTLFSSLKNDSVFYMVPDKLRRPLIFYFAHPAAVYANKLHLAGVLGTCLLSYENDFSVDLQAITTRTNPIHVFMDFSIS